MANWLTQHNRLLQLTTPLGPSELAPISFSGMETISAPFRFELKMISGNTTIQPEQLLGKPVSLRVGDSLAPTPRYFHGIVNHFEAREIQHGIRYYTAELMPWFSLLNYTSDCRIFQNLSVIDIAKKIFAELSFHDFDVSSLTNTYTRRDYCVQYNESSYTFLNRLFEEEGIFYFFRHQADKHILVLADKPTALKTCEANVVYHKGTQKGHCLTSWKRRHSFYSGKTEHNDFNYEQPSTSLLAQQQSTAKLTAAQKYARYSYPGSYQNLGQGKQISQQAFAAEELAYYPRAGSSNYASFSAGSKFTLTDLPASEDTGNYLLLTVEHLAEDGSYLGSSSSPQFYGNHFICLPAAIGYAPPRSTEKPVIHGAQSALVVGPKGEEIYTDQYGRVKVHFHWDRKGSKDDGSSCWVRVAQNWTGKNWGMVFMPRIGQEVLVQFINGDPDRPVIIGSVYNADNPAPYHLPFQQTRSGIKACSSKSGGAEANEFYFEDKLGQEEIHMHAQKDFNRIIQNDDSTVVVKGNHSTSVQAGKSVLEAAQSIELKVGGNSVLINTAGVYVNGQEVKVNGS